MQAALEPVRRLADQAFSRAAGAPLVGGNSIRLLRDARENYPAWLDAIGAARHHVHFENYIIRDDETGVMFAEAFLRKAQQGVAVRLVYDWLGSSVRPRRAFWQRLRAGGVEARCYNPPRFAAPLGWLSRDHRKMLSVDGRVAFVSGLCVGNDWVGVSEKGIAPWRDTGVELRGPAVADVERAFAHTWATLGKPLDEATGPDVDLPAGDVSVRIVATVPATAGMYRLDQLVAALARQRLWLTDAYYAGTPPYVQALCAAARDGVDVRLLLPCATDLPILQPLSRAGYRPLLEAGVRVFEWNGTMLHAKTAVGDGRWARVGSSNLNLQTWLGNCELDVVVEDEPFAREMEEMYLQDLAHATEIVLDARRKPRQAVEPSRPKGMSPGSGGSGGSGGRVAAGALRIGNTVGAAFTGRRTLEPVEARIMVTAGALLLALSVLFALAPRLLAYPVAVVFAWIGGTLLYRSYELRRERKGRAV